MTKTAYTQQISDNSIQIMDNGEFLGAITFNSFDGNFFVNCPGLSTLFVKNTLAFRYNLAVEFQKQIKSVKDYSDTEGQTKKIAKMRETFLHFTEAFDSMSKYKEGNILETLEKLSRGELEYDDN